MLLHFFLLKPEHKVYVHVGYMLQRYSSYLYTGLGGEGKCCASVYGLWFVNEQGPQYQFDSVTANNGKRFVYDRYSHVTQRRRTSNKNIYYVHMYFSNSTSYRN